MSASTGPSSKGEKGKQKFQSLDINSIYNNTRSEVSEAQQTKSTVIRKHGMQQLGKVPQRRPPANLPSLKSENSGNDPSISLVPTGGTGWGVKPSESQQLTPGGGNASSQNNQTAQGGHQSQSNTSTVSPAPAVGAPPAPTSPSAPPPSSQQSSSHDKTWSSVTGGSQAASLGLEHGPSFLAHQSPQFQQEFPSLSGEPGGAPAHPSPSYGPGPSLRPQTEPGSWSQGTHARPQPQPPTTTPQPNLNIASQFKSVVPSFLLSQGGSDPMFPISIQSKRSRSHPVHSDNRMLGSQNASRQGMGGGGGQGGNTGDSEDLIPRPIIREEDLHRMDELARDASWAANDDIDYNEQLSFSDGESIGEDEKEKENKLRDKSNKQPIPMKDEKKEDVDKTNRDKPFMSERDRNQQPWRTGNNMYSDFRNAPPRPLVQGSRVDDDDVWKEKRRQISENKMVAAERAKQRKEEEEKRYEESRAKKTNKDSSDFHMSISSNPDWDKEDRAKSTDNFRQMTQFQMEGRSNGRDRREVRVDRESQYSIRYQSKPPRFRKDIPKIQFGGISGGGSGGGGGGGYEKNWSNHNSFGRRGPDPMDKDDDFRKDNRHDRPPPDSDRFRPNMRDDVTIDSNKRNYYENVHMDYNQSSFQSNREADKDKEPNKDYDRVNEKDSSSRDADKEWESSKGETESRSFDDRRRRDNKSLNENFSKQMNEHFDEKENELRDRPQRPESRDRPERRNIRERVDHLENKLDNKDHRHVYRGDSSRDNIIIDGRFDARGDGRQDNRDSGRLDNRQDNRPEVLDNTRSDIRPSRPDSRDSRASRNSKDSSDKPSLLEGEYSLPENYFKEEKIERSFKDKDRRDPLHRVRDHVPGPITPEKMVAYEHKHNQSQMEKSDTLDKESDDKKLKKLNEAESSAQPWGESSRDDKASSVVQGSSNASQEPSRTDFSLEESKASSKLDEGDKRKENCGGMRDRREDNKTVGGGGGGVGGGRGNRLRSGARSTGYSTGTKYNMYPGPNWQSKDRQRRGSPRGRTKHWNQSESDGSGDEISAESGKDDKKTDRKQDCTPKYGTWKADKNSREDKKDIKVGGSDSDKERTKGDKKQLMGGGNIGDGGRKGSDSGGFAPRGEPSRRGRGVGGGMRGQHRLLMGPALYGPPGSKPFSSSSSGSQSNPPPLNLESQDKQFSPPQQSGRKNNGPGGKGRDSEKGGRGKGTGGGMRSQDENWETTSETSDSSDVKKPNKNRNKMERKSRGTIGDKRNIINSASAHLNGRPDVKPDDSGNEKKINKDDSETTGYSNNGFQEVKSKKTGRESRGPGGIKEEVKRSRSKGKEKPGGGGVKSQQAKSYTREFVNTKPPRLQRLDNTRKQQQMAHLDVSDMNKINQNVSSLFPLSRSNDVSNSCPPPPAINAWSKPINHSLSTTSPLSSTLSQLTAAPAQITTDKTNLEDLGQSGNTTQTNSPTVDKALNKMSREVVEKSMLDGPPVTTVVFENTNYKRDSGDIGVKSRYPSKGTGRTALDKSRDRKIEDELNEGNHSMSLGGFKSSSELQSTDGKPQDNIKVPISFGKNEDNADMKLDFAFDSDLSQLSDDKTNQSIHVGNSTADLNEKIASVKKVWDNDSAMRGHVDEATTSSFTQGFADKSLDPSAPSHHSNHSDFNTSDSVYGSGQLSGGGGYVAAGSSMMKPDTIVSGANTMCKNNMFQVSPQPQQVTVMPHPGPLSTPPPLPSVLSFQPGYSSNLSAVPSPPNVLYNSQQAAGPQTEIYQTYSLGTAQMHGSGNRSFADFPPPSYNMSQNSTFQPSMYMQSAPPPPNPQSVFQNPTQYRLPPHGSAAALSQQMNSNPNTMLMSSSSSSVVSGSQVKSTQGSMQPTAIGSKSGGGPPTAAYPPPSPQILLIEQPPVSFLHQGYHHRPATIQHSSSYFATNSALAPGGSTGGLFNSPSLLGGGGGGATTGNLPSASPFGVQPAASYSQQQPPSSTQPPSHHQQPPYPTQPQMGGSFRNQTGYPKAGQHPSDSTKSSSQDQFQSMFTQGSPKTRVGVVKPQPSASPQPQQHKFSYNPNPHSVSQSNLGYQQGGGGNGGSRQGQGGQGVGSMRSAPSVAPAVPQQPRYISPIQRPLGPTYSQQQHIMQQQQVAAVARQQQQQQQQQHRMQQQQQQSRPPPPSTQQQAKQQYYQQQGGGMKLEGSESVKSDLEEQGKTSQDKSAKDEAPSDQ